ncbi:hypothetical protein [Micromonospora sp. NBC_01796]|uniref:hypothetical protein n=1 Tax=Micromonospora sp. NBC_01796 TaxID=2975987 RepID=UPI002DD961E3|nr:hypothetical protein [Micromonospora sp. NBC_01796]WSA84714.1 hypothetical protein OIE47_30825 [Micromonospora sp. NBC_01796]
MPEPGDVLGVGAPASVQFGGASAITFRVTVVSKQPTYDGWVWLTGYVLNRKGEATEKREIFVQLDGLRLLARPHRTTQLASQPATPTATTSRPTGTRR